MLIKKIIQFIRSNMLLFIFFISGIMRTNIIYCGICLCLINTEMFPYDTIFYEAVFFISGLLQIILFIGFIKVVASSEGKTLLFYLFGIIVSLIVSILWFILFHRFLEWLLNNILPCCFDMDIMKRLFGR